VAETLQNPTALNCNYKNEIELAVFEKNEKQSGQTQSIINRKAIEWL